jgi:predicted transcriptional regulator
MNEGTKRHREYEKWFVRSVEAGIDAAERGETVPHAEVMDRLRLRLRRAASDKACSPDNPKR